MRLECLSTFDAYQKVGYSPSNRALRETRLASSRNDPEVASALVTRSSCLLFQFCRIEAFSFLPDL